MVRNAIAWNRGEGWLGNFRLLEITDVLSISLFIDINNIELKNDR
jgi:hypothetical protein